MQAYKIMTDRIICRQLHCSELSLASLITNGAINK
jgi:hypothetical protein